MKLKKTILFVTILLLLVGIVCASDISENTNADITDTIDTTSTDTSIETNEIIKEESITETKEIKKEEKNTKTETPTNVNDYTSLQHAIQSGSGEVTVNITQDITLDGNINVNSITLTINGNNKTINGMQNQFLTINSGSVTINNLTITNCQAELGGAIYNDDGTLTITNSNLTNNNANYEGGAIHNNGTLNITNSTLDNNNASWDGGAIHNSGTLNITNSTLDNNNASNDGGAIHNSGTLNITNSTLDNNNATWGGAITNYYGTLNITNSTLDNNNATWGGAIYNGYGTLNITNSNLTNNNASNGGAIFDYTDSYSTNEVIFFNSNFTENTAENGAVIYNYGGYGKYTITNNLLQKNTATGDKETLNLGENSAKTVEDNTYDSTDIKLKTINLIKEDKSNYTFGEDIILNFTIELENPEYYDSDILEKLDKTLYINDKENDTTKSTNHTLSQLKPNNYAVYYTTYNTNSNNVTFMVTANSQITSDKTSYEYYAGIKNNITLNITDVSGEEGTVDFYVKNGEIYIKLLSYPNIQNGSNIPIETIIESLNNIGDTLEDSYIIAMDYTSDADYILPNSTEFTLNIIKQRNTTITYNILNQTEKNFQINITVLDTIHNTPVTDAQIKITGDINQNTKHGIITDTTLTAGEYTINVTYEETEDYNPSNTTIDFTVEIDKDAKITELEETINNLTEQLTEAKDEISALNDTNNNLSKELNKTKETLESLNNTNKNLTEQLENAKQEITALNDTLNNLTSENEELNTQLDTLNDTLTQLQEENNQLKSNITNLNNLINELKDIIEELKNPTKNATTMTITPVTGSVGTTTQITATIKDTNGNTVSGGKVIFKVNGITLKDESGNQLYAIADKGTATINTTITKSWYKDNLKLEAVYAGNKYYQSTRANNTKNNITLGTAKLNITDLSSYASGDTIRFVIQITDDNNKPVNGGVIILKANGITLKDSSQNPIKAKVTNGVTVIDYNNTLSAKVYNLTAIYANTGYNRIEETTKLNITPGQLYINYTPITTSKNETTIQANVYYNNNIPANAKVGIKIDKKLATTTTSKNGIINVTIPTAFKAGTYAIEFVIGQTGAFESTRLTSVIIKE